MKSGETKRRSAHGRVLVFAVLLFAAVPPVSISYAGTWPKNKDGSTGAPSPIYVGDTNLTFHIDTYQWADPKGDGDEARSWAVIFIKKTASDIENGVEGAGRAPGTSSYDTWANSAQFTSAGTWYWAMRVSYSADDNAWACRQAADWTDMYGDADSTLSVTVTALSDPGTITVDTNATMPDTKIDVGWAQWNSKNVMVVRGTNASFFTPSGGTVYSVGYTSDDDRVIYNSTGTSCTDTGLTAGVTYYYRLFSENHGYYSGGADTNYTILLPEISVSGNGQEIADGDTTATTNDHTDFGTALLAGGTVVHTFTATNSGGATLNLTGSPSVAIAGTHAADFSLSSAPGTTTIGTDASTTFAITFNPSATGTRTASLSIANDDVSENPYNFDIKGTGVEPEMGLLGQGQAIASGDLVPTTADGTDFGSAALSHDSVDHAFVITNSGTGLLSLTNATRVAISGHTDDFAVISQPAATVAVAGSATFTLRFAPSVYGARTGLVSIANTDADENPYTFRIQGRAYKAAFIDDVGVGKMMPLCIDRDGDNVSDGWEAEYFGNTSSNWNGDADGDGWSNREEFLAGTNPTNSDSYFRVQSGGLVDNASTNIQLSFVGGNFSGPTNFVDAGDAMGRVYRIYAADGSVTNTKSLRATVSEGSTGTNLWTDVNATESASRRYYDVVVAYAGSAFTNTEEWALYVEPRTTNRSYLVSVPVNFGSTAANNLNSTLGEHLATGLNSSDTEADADKVRYVNASGGWDEYYLSDAVGWTTNGTNAANVTITPGQALWIVRGSNAAVRANSVFVGRSFSESDMVDTEFKTSGGGWTMFGWALPNVRQALASDTSADQLGFSSKGTGGTTAERNSTSHGDQLWVPNGDGGWDWYWLLDDGGGENGTNHRWYVGNPDGGYGYGNITLEPGGAYYYYHTTNSGGANFNWRPEIP